MNINLEELRMLAAAASKKREEELAAAIEIASLKQQISVANDTELTSLLAASALADANIKKIGDIKALVAEVITSTTDGRGERLRVYDSYNFEYKNPLLRECLSLATACVYASPIVKGSLTEAIKPLTLLELERLVGASGRMPYWNKKGFVLVKGFKANLSDLEQLFKVVLAKLGIEANDAFITASEYGKIFLEAEEKANLEEKAHNKLVQLSGLIKTI